MRVELAVLLAALLLGAADAADAHVVSDRDLQVFRSLPDGFVAHCLRDATPGVAGAVAPNRSDRWISVVHQRPAALLLCAAAASGDTALAEMAWSAQDAAFQHQSPSGGFQRMRIGAEDPEAWIEDAAWLGCCTRALIAVMNSSMADRFRWRYTLMKPKLQRSMDYLESRSERLIATNNGDAGALMVIAAAFLLGDGTFHDERYGRVGQLALARSLALQRSDGLFPAKGRDARAQHMLGLEALQSIVIYFPSPTLERSAASAAQWARARDRAATSHKRQRGMRSRASWDALSDGEQVFILRWSEIPLPPALGAPAGE